jgi:hypothetical protein
VPSVVATLAWTAAERGVAFEMYLETQRDGRLFAEAGSTVLGGHHHQQFNYLHARFDVSYIVLGEADLFRSSMDCFGFPVLAQATSALELYGALGVALAAGVCIVPDAPPAAGAADVRPYWYQEVFFGRAVGVPESESAALPRGVSASRVDASDAGDVASFTTRLARRWATQAEGVAFGDPDAILAMLATLCRERRVALYGPAERKAPRDIEASAYTEEHTSAAGAVKELVGVTGNSVLVGRQTGDGDLFEWAKTGICIQIMDPNRPAFPVVATLSHRWVQRATTVFDLEPDDATLERWADEGKRLASLLVHSGEMAHNEAMLNLVELCSTTGLKLGIGVHAARYETCPQLWELIAVPRNRGGALGLVEPVLHSGGMGVLAESECPPAALAGHCREALRRIGAIAGDAWKPRGYLAFMDSDMSTFTRTTPDAYAAIEESGLSYTVSSALPGRNRILHRTASHLVLNQSTRSICTGSPYVRITTASDIGEKTPGPSPGWWLGVIDAPVVAFNSYIWERGPEFMAIVRHLTTRRDFVNTTPHVVSRYARLLVRRGVVV